MMKIKSRFLLFLILLFFWILWNNSLQLAIWLYGVIPAILIVWLFGPSNDIFKGTKLTPKGIFFSLLYIIVFIWAMIKSNIDVLIRVISPKLKINPGIVRVKTQLKSPMARLILANSITLTPGTFVVDIKDDLLYIHWIDVSEKEDIQMVSEAIAGSFEKILLKIYE